MAIACDNNIGQGVVGLFSKVYEDHTQRQQAFGREITVINDQLKDISELTKTLTKKLSSGALELKDDLVNVAQRVESFAKGIITAENGGWHSKEEIKSQIELLREKAQELTQNVNMTYTKMSQAEREMGEITQIFFDMVKKWAELLKCFLKI